MEEFEVYPKTKQARNYLIRSYLKDKGPQLVDVDATYSMSFDEVVDLVMNAVEQEDDLEVYELTDGTRGDRIYDIFAYFLDDIDSTDSLRESFASTAYPLDHARLEILDILKRYNLRIVGYADGGFTLADEICLETQEAARKKNKDKEKYVDFITLVTY